MDEIRGVVVRRVDDGPVSVGYERIPRPSLGAHDLLVRPEFVGVCGSDVKLITGDMDSSFPIRYPHTLGHEWSGTVLATGADVRLFREGQLIIGHGSLGDQQWFGVTHDGAMADIFAVPEVMSFAVPDGVSAKSAALVEPLACVLHGLHEIGGCDASETAIVLGCGTIGLAMVALLHSTGAAVIAVDPNERRRDIAFALGADLVLAPKPAADMIEDVVAAGLPGGAHLVVECSGSPDAQAASLSLAAVRGRVLYLGLSYRAAVEAPLGLIHTKHLRIGTTSGAPPHVWEPALRLIARTGLDLSPAVSEVYSFEQCEQALTAAAHASVNGKVMLCPRGTQGAAGIRS